MRNKDLRDYARVKDVKLWEVAEKIGICDSNFSRLLRRELSTERKEELKRFIDEIEGGR